MSSTKTKLALITPSASPPIFKNKSSIPPRGRSTSISPTKRQRLSSSRAPSVSANVEDNNIENEREASIMRLMASWTQLGEKYSKPIDEDDIVDITTGEVVKDRGVLRGMTNPREFGGSKGEDLASRPASRSEKSNEDQPRNDGEESEDELDFFAHLDPLQSSKTGDESEPEEARESVQDEEEDEGEGEPSLDITPFTRVRALDPSNAEDAADLKEFLEAEKRRAELFGNEETDDGETDEQSYLGGSRSSLEQSVEPRERLSTQEHENDESQLSGDDFSQRDFQSDHSFTAVGESEDELDIVDSSIEISSPVKKAFSLHEVAQSKSSSTSSQASVSPSKSKNSANSHLPTSSQDQGKSKAVSNSTKIQPRFPSRKRSQKPLPSPHLDGSPSPVHSLGETYYDYVVPFPPKSPQTPKRTPSPPSSPLPPSSPPPSSPLHYPLPTPSPSTSREMVSSSPPSSPSKPERMTRSASKALTTMQVRRPQSPSIKRAVTPKEVPVVLITKRPLSLRRLSGDTEKISSSTTAIPRLDLAKEAARSIQKKNNKKSLPSPSNAPSSSQASTSANILKLPSNPSSNKTKEYSIRGRRSAVPGIADGVSQRTRSRSQSNSSPRSRVPEAIPTSSSSPTNPKRSLKGKEKEVVVDDDFTGRHEDHRSRLKRKRDNSSSSDRLQAEEFDQGPSQRRARTAVRGSSDSPEDGHRLPLRKRLKQRLESAHSDDEGDENYKPHSQYRSHPPSPPSNRRAQSYVDPYHSLQYKQEVDAPSFNPLHDPRAQSILSSAFQQLSTLFGAGMGPWNGSMGPSMYDDPHSYPYSYRSPYDQHQRDEYGGYSNPQTPRRRSRVPSGPFTTPTHRPHPYPHSFDPNLSRGTLPPSSPSPEPSDDEPKSQERRPPRFSEEEEGEHVVTTQSRRSSLVERSRSRGRRVSWGHVEHIDEVHEYVRDERYEEEEEDSPSRGRRPIASRHATPGVLRQAQRQVPEDGSSQDVDRGRREEKRFASSNEAKASSSHNSSPRKVPTSIDIIELTDSDTDGKEAVRERKTSRGQTPSPSVPKDSKKGRRKK